MFKRHIRNILQSELDNKAVHLLLPMKERNKSNYTCSMYIFETSSLKIVSRYSPCNTNKKIMCTLKTVSNQLDVRLVVCKLLLMASDLKAPWIS